MKHFFKVLTLFSVVSVVLMVSSCPHKSDPESTTIQGMVKLDLKGRSFQMGADYTGAKSDEKPVHNVTFTRDIYMCDHEVTQAEWQAVMGSNPSYFQGEDANKEVAVGEVQKNRPVEQVSWYDAIAYCNKLSIKDGLEPCYSVKVYGMEIDWKNLKYDNIPTDIDDGWDDCWDAAVCDFSKNGYRLPTEAEWEYAARDGIADIDKAVWAGTTDETVLKNYAWYDENSDNRTHEVKKNQPNGYGLYDMSGNVWEWCWDWYSSSYASEDATNPTGASSGSNRVGRGGSWPYAASGCRASSRIDSSPSLRSNILGFRLVRTVQ